MLSALSTATGVARGLSIENRKDFRAAAAEGFIGTLSRGTKILLDPSHLYPHPMAYSVDGMGGKVCVVDVSLTCKRETCDFFTRLNIIRNFSSWGGVNHTHILTCKTNGHVFSS